MQGLRAFVGHSFLERDERLVQKFLGYLNTLTKAHLGFSWDHALAAEPLPLHEKVLAKIADKNVFIGICTKGERAVRNEALSPILFRPARLAGAAVDFHWKTSDWLIQEIGLAVGRNMRIILLLEEDVRPPGGLYGNIEYIPFNRDKPDTSFERLLQMLLALTPPERGVGTAAPEPEVDNDEPKKEEAAGKEWDWEPKPDWTREQYERTAFRAIFTKKPEQLKVIENAFAASDHSKGIGIAEATLRGAPIAIAKKWKDEKCVLDAKIEGMTVSLWGSYEEVEPFNRLAGIGGLLSGPLEGSQKIVRRIEFTLQVRGHVLLGKVKRTRDGAPSTLLGLGIPESTNVLMYLQAGQRELCVMEGSSKFYTLTSTEGQSEGA